MATDQRFTGNAMNRDETPPGFPWQESPVRIFLSGDVMTGRGIDQVLPQHVDPEIYESYVKDARDYVRLAEKKNGRIPQPVSYAYIWGDALEVWRKMAPDLKIMNLETSITNHPEPWPGKPVQYRMHPANVAVFKTAGIDFCTLANNHTLDWNREGLLETLQTLRKAGINFAGAGENALEARKPFIHKTRNSRIIIFAYGSESSGIPGNWVATTTNSGVNLLPDLGEETLGMIKAQVKAIKKSGDVVVFSVHWDTNWGYEIPPNHRKFARQLIDEAEVDLIHGHSSHHPRGIEVYKDKLILYGAGDFINDYEGIGSYEEFRGDLSLMYFPEINPVTGKLISLKMVPMQMRNFRLNRASAADAKWLSSVLDRESEKFGTRVTLQEDHVLTARW
ncbi:CapA family protein [Adhaeribacter sp. BT258]|uniref:CapA family protein n=1 Tax=Adhaeribacter terrigena TaxID=2793070 RepID=A0ABS1BZD8_9BACT|nr:CapA family protein [Adhaeribacter terrigena]MBK0402489.1 CapA family protein [Adhaeribacter terrigena]